MKAEIIDVMRSKNDNDVVVLKMIDPIKEDELKRTEWQDRNFAYLDLFDNRYSTDEQRKHFWALIGDIKEHTGKRQGMIVLNMKALYMITKDTSKEPSVARGKMKRKDVAEWLQMIIDWCIDNEIPFRHPDGYVPEDISKMMYKLTMNRMCVVCGKPHSDIAHFDGTVGMGRNRKTINHQDSKFLALCRQHHSEQRSMGEEAFIEKYHLAPLKLDVRDLKKLGVM